jgi:quercetin dioxygenase-like cupin family protein
METTTETINPTNIYLREPGDGRHLHVLDNLATLKTVAGAGQSMAVVEFTAPRNFGPPLHAHRHEDEFLYVLDGELDVQIDGEWRRAKAGSFAWLPRAVPHTFQVMTSTARMLSATAGETAAFDQMMADLGCDVTEPTLPDPMDIDPGHVAMVSATYGVEILGPPPAERA